MKRCISVLLILFLVLGFTGAGTWANSSSQDSPVLQMALWKIIETDRGYCAIYHALMESLGDKLVFYNERFEVERVFFLSDIGEGYGFTDVYYHDGVIQATAVKPVDVYDYLAIVIKGNEVKAKHAPVKMQIAEGAFFWTQGQDVFVSDLNFETRKVSIPSSLSPVKVGMLNNQVAVVAEDKNVYVQNGLAFQKLMAVPFTESDLMFPVLHVSAITLGDEFYVVYESEVGKHLLRLSDKALIELETAGAIESAKRMSDGSVMIQMLNSFAADRPVSYHQLLLTGKKVDSKKVATLLQPYGEDEVAGWTFRDKDGNDIKTFEFFRNAHIRVNGKETSFVLPFRDMAETDWFYPEVERVYYEKIVEGTGHTTFTPKETVDAAMFTTILYRLHAKYNGFSPKTEGKWYEVAMKWAKDSKIIAPERLPDHKLTRLEISHMIYRFIVLNREVLKGGVLSKELLEKLLPNVETSNGNALEWNVEARIFQGSEEGMREKALATRAEISTVLRRIMNLFPTDWKIEEIN